ncbi:adenosine deaminase CECR1 [Aquimarina sp. MAR_2010_214]|uniref:adenosine kinase n=1 Tax=Aquimarina sp. MAR_2010_214 TaxID=1250026 RepID=UPI000C70E61A|nr:adenosine kinase [Aquimarina sp. MAR_2010_214]PKV51140.1 adenosine deaminase CECR1 [Aquimarina sp. MAR_2010_214]
MNKYKAKYKICIQKRNINRMSFIIKNHTVLILLLSIFISCKNSNNTTTPETITSQETYNERREQLIAIHEKNSFDVDIQLSKEELELEQKISAYRNAFEKKRKRDNIPFFNQPFHAIQPIIDSSTLYKVLQKMPKGGLLHTHSIGMTDIKWLIEEAIKTPNCYVYVGKDNEMHIYGELAIFKEENVPNDFVLLKDQIKSDTDFKANLYELLVLKRVSFSDRTDYWTEFEKRFRRVSKLLNFRPFFLAYYKKAFLDLIEDKVSHVEIRMVFNNLYDLEKSDYPIEIMVSDLQKVISEIEKEGKELSISLIYTSFKFFNTQEIDKEIAKAFNLKKKFPNMISGFDLVAEEDKGNSVQYYEKNWQKIDSMSSKFGLELPLFLHAGESKSITNTNLIDVSVLKNRRIGHALNLVLFPEIMRQVKEKDMLVEVCPISNQILGYVNDLRNHPARILLNNGIQCSINSDDPGVFAYEGLSYDFWMVCMAWELDIKAIKKLVFNSITYSGLTNDKKEILLLKLKKDWNVFINEANLIMDKQFLN